MRYAFAPLAVGVVEVALVVSGLVLHGTSALTVLYATIPVGPLILGNDLVHMWPVVFVLLHAFIYRPVLYDVLVAEPVEGPGWNVRWRAALWVECVWGGALVGKLAYGITLLVLGTSVNRVYGTQVALPLGVSVFFALPIYMVGVPLVLWWEARANAAVRPRGSDAFSAAGEK